MFRFPAPIRHLAGSVRVVVFRARRYFRDRRERTDRGASVAPLPALQPLQRAGARLFFAALCTGPLPARLERHLSRVNLHSALTMFADELGASLTDLLDSRAARREAAVARVRTMLPLLSRIDAACAAATLDGEPLFAALRGTPASVTALLERFTAAAVIARALHTTRVDFGPYETFRTEMSLLLESWTKLSAADITEAFNVLNDFAVAQAALDRQRTRFDATFANIVALASSFPELEPVVNGLRLDRERIDRGVTSGMLAPEAALREFAALLDRASVVADHLRAISDAELEAEPETDDGLRARACGRLGVAITATIEEIKHAYWRLAKKYHPDRNRDREAAALFCQITDAYHWLTAHRTA